MGVLICVWDFGRAQCYTNRCLVTPSLVRIRKVNAHQTSAPSLVIGTVVCLLPMERFTRWNELQVEYRKPRDVCETKIGLPARSSLKYPAEGVVSTRCYAKPTNSNCATVQRQERKKPLDQRNYVQVTRFSKSQKGLGEFMDVVWKLDGMDGAD